MINRLTISNYQSIAEADLQLGKLTVVVGDNRAGKSATLRALRALLFNETGTDQIRRDQKASVVSIELEEMTVTWEKKRAGGATYVLTNNSDSAARTFTKLGSTVPPEVEDVLGIRPIKVSDTVTLTPQSHAQEDYAFLLDLSAGQAAKALAKFTRLDVVVEAQGLIRTDLRRSKADIATYEKMVEEAELRLASYQDLATVDAELTAVEALITEAEELHTDLLAGTAAWQRYTDAEVGSHIVVPDGAQLEDAQHLITRLFSQESAMQNYEEAYDRVQLAAQRIVVHDMNATADTEAWAAIKTCPECGQPVVH